MADDGTLISGPIFSAVGADGLRAFSADGRVWSHQKLGKEGEVLAISVFGAGRCVVAGRFGGSDHFFASADALNWDPSEHDAKYSNYVRNVVFFRGQFLAFAGENSGGGKPFILPSDDGVHWGSPRPVSNEKEQRANSLLRRFAMGNDLIVAVGDYGRKAVSRDGAEWHNAPGVKAVDTLIDVAFGNGVFAGGGMHGLCMRSTNGLAWGHRATGEEGEHINSMIWDGKQFVGVGQGATYISPDAQKWDRIPNTDAPTVAAFGAGTYVGSLWQGRLMKSTDGIHWTESARLQQHVYGLAFGTLGKDRG